MPITSNRYQEIKKAALAKHAARQTSPAVAGSVKDSSLASEPAACFETAEAIIIEYALKNKGKI